MLSSFKSTGGFTLVELSIVLMLIGLLIGGVLRGQELLMNSRITSTIQQVHSINAATNTFRDLYGGFPGDIISPNTRIPGCTTTVACSPSTNTGLMNNIIGTNVTTAFNSTYGTATALDTENRRFWSQLAASHMISGIDPTSTSVIISWGAQFPSSKLGGGFHIAHMSTIDLALVGHFLVLRNNPSSNSVIEGLGTALISPHIAYILDSKIDQGTPSAGDVRSVSSYSGSSGSGCMYTDSSYLVSDRNLYCVLLIRL